MKILFLDIDGVLNSMDNMHVRTYLWHKNNDFKTRDDFGQLFDERCVRWLQYIVENTDCKIVISSTWRFSGLETIKALWKERKLPGEVIGCTPITASEETINLYATGTGAERGYEIQDWIIWNDSDSYCIVDDDGDMLPHQNFVRTNPVYGLDRTSAITIVSILNKEKINKFDKRNF